MQYAVAVAAAEADAAMYRDAVVTDDHATHRIVVTVAGHVVASHEYRD
jgi:hypothetical protein